ncbi:DUF429 domain-containing protein [Thermoleptolyngbya sp. PKUAC-SCTB121]|uniref:DUF429 domain-containing protein n=1 Tax=Thermoleptolyngbya sp. PKUAC-SCTB121 TaxID=2811482 RepID=UPI0019632813|nr:DUF429 domain-containing protein [Thermoleptolyngbya sp. PKUAC-SCTB121]
MKFLGIDFGWTSQPSGLCCLVFQDNALWLKDLTRLADIPDLLAWIDACVSPEEPAGVAVDAPTLIPNATGMRLPDRLAHKHFGRYHAGCYPANLGLPFAQRTVQLGLSLEARGFAHAPTIQPQAPIRFQIESFPHPAMVHLFGLSRILKYKKGTVAERRAELAKLRHYVLTVLPVLTPALHFMPDQTLPNIPMRGVDLKAVEDMLDSIVCAYIAAHWWYWGEARNWVLGDRTQGYIVVPAPAADPSSHAVAAMPVG